MDYDPSVWPTPWVQLKYFSFQPTIYPAMVLRASPDAAAGQMVHVYDRNGQRFGQGFYNPKARVPLRIFHHGLDTVDESFLDQRVRDALDLRLERLRLPDRTDAFRVIHSDGDGLSGLVMDKLGDILVVEVHARAMHDRLVRWIPLCMERLGTQHVRVRVDPVIARMEGIRPVATDPEVPRVVRFRENGIRYEADLEEGHKTGFFCDQRENRRRLTEWTQGCRVLDLCCYTGGFSLSAKLAGGATEVTGVDLDEDAIAQARRNAHMNQARIEWVHVDAFSYARQMQRNRQRWDVVVLDPPKLIPDRESVEEGVRRYEDLNGLAASLVEPGGLFVTCSCSGLLGETDFEAAVIRAIHRQGRRLQILDKTGAGADHPVMTNCLEGRYLKVIWGRVV
jgi:23S rRNA (cytosine1962-C5)-methyltransferase